MGYLAIWDYLCSADDIVTRRDGYLFRVLQNSKITYRPHCPGTGGGAFNISNFLNQTTMKRETKIDFKKALREKT